MGARECEMSEVRKVGGKRKIVGRGNRKEREKKEKKNNILHFLLIF